MHHLYQWHVRVRKFLERMKMKTNSDNSALKLFEQVQNYAVETGAKSACIVMSSREGCELVFSVDDNAKTRLSRLVREEGEAAVLMSCSKDGAISMRHVEGNPPLDEFMMTRVREEFEAMHYARLLYPGLPRE
jgi:hypothetical protein